MVDDGGDDSEEGEGAQHRKSISGDGSAPKKSRVSVDPAAVAEAEATPGALAAAKGRGAGGEEG